MVDPKWISLREGCVIAGKDTAKALTCFIDRWNHDNLDHLILRIPKKVDEHSLRYAVRVVTERHTPGMGLRKQLAAKRGSQPLVKSAR